MPRVTVPLGKMNLDKGSNPGDHLWVAKNCFFTPTGYETMPARKKVGSSFGPGQLAQGMHFYSGGSTGRIYAAFPSQIREIDPATATATDVSGSTYTNLTNGMTFASYGEYCFASNGVEKIQQIRVPAALGSAENFGDMNYTDTGAVIAPKYILSHKNHLIGLSASMLANYGLIGEHTTAVGAAFTNQPSGDSVTVTSASGAADNGITATIYGTRVAAGDTVSFEQVTLAGLGTATTAITNWNRILAVKKGVSAGDFTFTETSGGLTIVSVLAASINAGVSSVTPNLGAGDQLITIVADGATTRQVGITYTKYVAGTFYDSQALTGTTELQSNERMLNVQEVLIGDVESTRTVTISAYNYAITSEHPFTCWISGTEDPEGFGLPAVSPTIVGCEVLPLFDGAGKITGGIDGGDCFFVFKEGSVYRVDGPPFVPTVISYEVGMPAGCTPYRQDSYIYFWSNAGLQRIDINTNQITNLFRDRVLRAVTDWGSLSSTPLIAPTFPEAEPGQSALDWADVVNTSGTARIAGHSKYGLVFVCFNSTAPNANRGLVYQSYEDAFIIPDGQWIDGTWPIEIRRAPSTAEFPFSAIGLVIDAGASNELHSYEQTGVGGSARSADEIMYVALPFIEMGPQEPRMRVKAIRPRLSEMYIGSDFDNDASVCYVITRTGDTTPWTGCATAFNDGWSEDGWIYFPTSTYGKAHAIVIMPYTTTPTSNTLPGNFSALEIEFEPAPSRSR